MQQILSNNQKNEIGIYVHIPFCVKKCAYCDFLSASADEKSRSIYIDSLLNEVISRSIRINTDGDYIVTSIFVGGGTPSILDARDLTRIIECIKSNLNVSENAEITFECNPGTASFDKLKSCKDAGFNRISIGLQSAVDEELKWIGRIHDFKRFLDTYNDAIAAGFDNINVDLISALPGQTMESLEYSIKKILSLEPAPKHVSAYSLILEEGTPLYEQYESGKLAKELPDEDTERDMHWKVIEMLSKAGYELYELSNLAKPGYECYHNLGYWTRRAYIGFGIGAASLYAEMRFTNTRDIEKYNEFYRAVRTDAFDKAPLEEETILSKQDAIEEFMFLGLRLSKGVSYKDFYDRFDSKLEDVYGDVIEKNIKNGLLVREENRRLYLTKRGQDVANYVFSEFVK